jgi:hypothetical protein
MQPKFAISCNEQAKIILSFALAQRLRRFETGFFNPVFFWRGHNGFDQNARRN